MTQIAFRSRTLWAFVLAAALAACTAEKNPNAPPAPPATPDAGTPPAQPPPDPNKTTADATFDQGKDIFRNDTFGDETFWSGVLQLDKAIEGSAHGGVGGGVDPTTALKVGLKVDMDALPAAVVTGVKNGTISLTSPETTLALIKLNAVVGLKGTVDATNKLTNLGITCAVCHSTVDNAFAPGIGHRLDGWPNRDLNVGAIVNLSPDLTPVVDLLNKGGAGVTQDLVRTVVLPSWGPGKFDAELFMDGHAFNPSPSPQGALQVIPNVGASAATLIPAAFGLRGVNLHTYTGWGAITQWNAFVAVLEMHGQGNYTDERLNNPKFPVAVANNFFRFPPTPLPPEQDKVSSKLGPLQFYQLSIDPPKPTAGTDFISLAADRGKGVFEGKAKCATCHVAPLFTDAGWNMHTGAEVGIDEFQASRSPDNRYRTTPLRGLFAKDKFNIVTADGQLRGANDPPRISGYYHDGRFATLQAVADHYATTLGFTFAGTEREDLIEYLKSL